MMKILLKVFLLYIPFMLSIFCIYLLIDVCFEEKNINHGLLFKKVVRDSFIPYLLLSLLKFLTYIWSKNK